MKIPKSISPDRIKDSIVEVKYTSQLPYEILIGVFFNAIDDTFTYSNNPIGRNNLLPLINNQNEVTINIGGYSPLFFNKDIKVDLKPNSIVFNCINAYIGWNNYFQLIQKILTQIYNTKKIDCFTRIGFRYISEYQNFDLKDCVKFNFSFGRPEIQSDRFTFRAEFYLDNSLVILNLMNKLKTLQPISNSSISTVSLIDIDVIKDNLEIKELNQFFEVIESCHKIEKEFFFNLLKEEFLKTLNPIY
jgi:uncharacterized protein (TIGR04255 family)